MRIQNSHQIYNQYSDVILRQSVLQTALSLSLSLLWIHCDSYYLGARGGGGGRNE